MFRIVITLLVGGYQCFGETSSLQLKMACSVEMFVYTYHSVLTQNTATWTIQWGFVLRRIIVMSILRGSGDGMKVSSPQKYSWQASTSPFFSSGVSCLEHPSCGHFGKLRQILGAMLSWTRIDFQYGGHIVHPNATVFPNDGFFFCTFKVLISLTLVLLGITEFSDSIHRLILDDVES
jgi:hypothetical protein